MPPYREVVRARAVEVARGGGGKDAVGGELRPARRRHAVRGIEGVGLLPERATLHQRSAVRDRERRLDTAVGGGVGGRVRDDLVPGLRPVRRVRVVAAVNGRGRVPAAEVQFAVAVDRGSRVDGRAAGDLDPVDPRRRRPSTGAAASLPRAGTIARPAAPPRRDSTALQVQPVEVAEAVADFDRRGAAVVEFHRRSLRHAARRVVEDDAGIWRAWVPRLGERQRCRRR